MAPRNSRRRLQHHGALGEIERADDVDRVGIGGQPQRLGIHQLGVDDGLVVLDADALQALADRVDADALKGVGERALRVREVDVVVDLVQGRLARCAVLEIERADAGFDFVRRGDRRRDCRRRLGGGQAGQYHTSRSSRQAGAWIKTLPHRPGRRTYVLECIDGEWVFRRRENELIVEKAFEEVFRPDPEANDDRRHGFKLR